MNVLELLSLFVTYFSVLAKHEDDPTMIPLAPQTLLWGDNTAASKWLQIFSRNLLLITNALQIFVKYFKDSDVSAITQHIKGKSNVMVDSISRRQESYNPHKESFDDIPFPKLLSQVLLNHRNLSTYSAFLLDPKILFNLSYIINSNISMAVSTQKKHYRQFVPADYIFSGFANNTICSTFYFFVKLDEKRGQQKC